MRKHLLYSASTLCLLLLSAVQLNAQAIKLNKYNFGEGLRFSGNSGYSMILRGYMQPYMEVKKYTGQDEIPALYRFRMRRLRVRLRGSAAQERIDYRFQVDLTGSGEAADGGADQFLLDAWVRYKITDRIGVTFGQRATPTDNRELFMLSNTLQLPERSRVTSSFASIREFGFFFDARLRLRNGSYLKPYLTITNGDGKNAYNADFGGLKFGGRLDYLPFGLFSRVGQFRQADVAREISPKLVVGANASINQGMSSRRGRESGAILYLNDDDEVVLPDYVKYGVDFMLKYRGFSVLGEFVGSQATVPEEITQRVRNNGTTSREFLVDGEQDVENYIKGRIMLGYGYNLQLGYLFKNLYSIDGRFTYIDADQHSFLNNGTFYNRPRYYTIGASKYFDRSYGAKIQASFTYIEAKDGSNDIYGDPISGDEWIIRIISTISF